MWNHPLTRSVITILVFSILFLFLLRNAMDPETAWSIAVILGVFASLLADIIRALTPNGCGGNCKCKKADKQVLNG